MRCNELHCLHISVASDTHLCQHLWAAMHKRKYLMVLHQQEEETVHICAKLPTFLLHNYSTRGRCEAYLFLLFSSNECCRVWRQNKLCVSVSASLMGLFSLPPVSRFLTSLPTSASSGISLPRCLNISASSSSASSRLMFSSTPSLCPSN